MQTFSLFVTFLFNFDKYIYFLKSMIKGDLFCNSKTANLNIEICTNLGLLRHKIMKISNSFLLFVAKTFIYTNLINEAHFPITFDMPYNRPQLCTRYARKHTAMALKPHCLPA